MGLATIGTVVPVRKDKPERCRRQSRLPLAAYSRHCDVDSKRFLLAPDLEALNQIIAGQHTQSQEDSRFIITNIHNFNSQQVIKPTSLFRFRRGNIELRTIWISQAGITLFEAHSCLTDCRQGSQRIRHEENRDIRHEIGEKLRQM